MKFNKRIRNYLIMADAEHLKKEYDYLRQHTEHMTDRERLHFLTIARELRRRCRFGGLGYYEG